MMECRTRPCFIAKATRHVHPVATNAVCVRPTAPMRLSAGCQVVIEPQEPQQTAQPQGTSSQMTRFGCWERGWRPVFNFISSSIAGRDGGGADVRRWKSDCGLPRPGPTAVSTRPAHEADTRARGHFYFQTNVRIRCCRPCIGVCLLLSTSLLDSCVRHNVPLVSFNVESSLYFHCARSIRRACDRTVTAWAPS